MASNYYKEEDKVSTTTKVSSWPTNDCKVDKAASEGETNSTASSSSLYQDDEVSSSLGEEDADRRSNHDDEKLGVAQVAPVAPPSEIAVSLGFGSVGMWMFLIILEEKLQFMWLIFPAFIVCNNIISGYCMALLLRRPNTSHWHIVARFFFSYSFVGTFFSMVTPFVPLISLDGVSEAWLVVVLFLFFCIFGLLVIRLELLIDCREISQQDCSFA